MINQSHKLSGPFLIDLKNRFRQIAGSDNKIDRKEFENGLLINDAQVINRIFDIFDTDQNNFCLLYTSPSPRDMRRSRMPSSA